MNKLPTGSLTGWLNKVPEVALSFWIIKIMSTTVGETGADFLAVNAGLGQGVTRTVMAALLGGSPVCTVAHPPLHPLDLLADGRYWSALWVPRSPIC